MTFDEWFESKKGQPRPLEIRVALREVWETAQRQEQERIEALEQENAELQQLAEGMKAMLGTSSEFLAVLIHKLGGRVTLTESDHKDAQGLEVTRQDVPGGIMLSAVPRPGAQVSDPNAKQIVLLN